MDMVSPFRIATLVLSKDPTLVAWLAVLTLVLLAVGLIWGWSMLQRMRVKAIALELSTYMCRHPFWPWLAITLWRLPVLLALFGA